jgi:hypothetical protein
MSARKNIKTVIGLSFRGCGWVFAPIGVLFLLRWLLFKITQLFGQVHSAPLDLYGIIGAISLTFGVACFLVARHMLRTENGHDC